MPMSENDQLLKKLSAESRSPSYTDCIIHTYRDSITGFQSDESGEKPIFREFRIQAKDTMHPSFIPSNGGDWFCRA
jgi:hypothetical protein